ncbi:MAG: hypothetical protein PUB41_07685 [bacterium]|nr:hypothetical protein [bacterium]MDD6226110.1 hypothetical protein [bacterium]MDY3862372.1 hypothetical protein [Ruminococcus sp.]
MGYVYAGMWAIIAVYLFVTAFKLNKVLFLGSGLFAFMSVWWLVNEFTEVNLFEGQYGLIFRIVVAVVLIGFLIVYFLTKRRNKD